MSHYKLSEKELEEKLSELQNLIKSRNNLPENINEILLMRLLVFYNGNIEKALMRLIANFELRKTYSNIFYNRDTLNPQLRKLINQVEMVLLPKVTKDNNRIMTLRLIDYNPDQLVFDDGLKVFTMVNDTFIKTQNENAKFATGEIVVFDLQGLTARHVTRMGISSLRCFLKYMIDVHPVRIKEIHVVNAHSLLDKLMYMLKPFISARHLKVIHFHLPNSTTLFEYIPRDILPEEYGGTFESNESWRWFWIHKCEENRDYLLDDKQWMIEDDKENEVNSSAIEDISIENAFSYMGFC